ncbi:variant erythrocyte surface antigen-1 family protein [Babesia caballi]|uniref:Variant erythrocyte surface antigen-1 family protein n=1 Tax=Babesia caballi TaxID=5871 RepID=A0AAV4LMZ8_BABCB|nr:variant erythrocyte surface antigen-1 family protein [Babesia caballi]
MLPLYSPLSTQSTSPFDCPSNLKEAIDWILRVTGKDGGGGPGGQNGTQAINELSNKVKELLRGVEGYATGLSNQEFESVIQALNSNSGANGLIGKLADGLQQFIGYQSGGSKGIIDANKGIAVSNIPIERLRDAVLTYQTALKLPSFSTQIDNAIKALNGGIGGGQQGFEKAVKEAETALKEVNVNGDIKNVLDEVKDVSAIKSNHNSLNAFAGKVKDYFTEVLEKVADDTNVKRANGQQLDTKVKELKTNLANLVDQIKNQNDAYPINVGQSSLNGQTHELKTHIEKVNGKDGALKGLYNAFNSNNIPKNHREAFALSAAACNGVNLFVSVLQTDYTSYYKGATWNQVSGNENSRTCAKIFLACLPLIFNGLSYFYWKCSDTKGWKTITLGSPEPKAFIGLTSIGANRVKSGLTGSDVLSKAFQNFKEFKTAANGSTTSYAEFMKTFRGNCLTNWKTSSNGNDNFLSGLYLCSTSYFRHQHQKQAANARPPSSIREMLYWLMGLTATPQFGDLLGHIDKVVGDDFKVAVSNSSNKNERLFADKVTSYILATCSGYLCHVPMGFNPNDLRAESNANTQGSHISVTLEAFCGGFNTPLRQLSEKLGCLTKRTPRSLGDLFGFTWHLNGQLSNTLSDFNDAQWFSDLKVQLPFSYQLTSESGQKLKTFVGTMHTNSHKTADLYSLYNITCSGTNCGPYLSPLTLSPDAPLAKLLESIDSFLYLFRYYFLSNLSGFWSIYVCIILYTFFFLLDTLHLCSHLSLTSSHVVPALALLTSGKPLSITKLTYIGQQPAIHYIAVHSQLTITDVINVAMRLIAGQATTSPPR